MIPIDEKSTVESSLGKDQSWVTGWACSRFETVMIDPRMIRRDRLMLEQFRMEGHGGDIFDFHDRRFTVLMQRSRCMTLLMLGHTGNAR